MIGTISILEGTGRACFAPYISHECVGGKVKVAGRVEKGKIKFSAFFSQIQCRERGDEEWAITWIALCNELLQLSQNLGKGHASVDGFDLCDEELLVPIQSNRQHGISPWIRLICDYGADVDFYRL